MIPLNIVIRTYEDTEPAFPHVIDGNYQGESNLEAVSILENGTVNGKTSLGFLIKLPNGKYTIVQTTAALLDMIWHALQGAEQRFADIKANKQ